MTTNETSTQECADGFCIIVIGPHCWGKAKTIAKAKKNAMVNAPRGNKKWLAFLCPAEAYVNDMGGFNWDSPKEGEPDKTYYRLGLL